MKTISNYKDQTGKNNETAGDDKIDLNWAYVSGPIGGVQLDAGRLNFKPHTGNILDTEFDGAKLAYGDNVKLTGYVGKAAKDVFDYDYNHSKFLLTIVCTLLI